jgi:cobalt-zinc-cadmium efflux system membrane fusion protein
MLNRIIIIFLMFFLISCSNNESDEKVEIKNPNEVTAKLETLKQISIEPAKKYAIRRTIDIPGSIEVKQNLLAKIGSPVKGRIVEINVMLGQRVRKGEVLAKINSTELAKMQLEYIKAVQQVELKAKSFERAELLFAEGVLSEAQMLERKTELAAAKAEMQASNDQLQVLGMSLNEIQNLKTESQINSITHIQAKIDGKVIMKNVNLGQVVEPTDEVFAVAALDEVWGVAQVPERKISFLKEGDQVFIEVPAYKEKSFEGVITYLGDIVDPETRTITIRTDINNQDQMLKPDMLITMKVAGSKVEKIGVPNEAIISEDDTPSVFVKTSENTFTLKPVILGIKDKDNTHIDSGISEGDEVVIKGAFHLNNERMYRKD